MNARLSIGGGVAFTRNPSTGENKYYGEFLINAQGEDVVAGIRTPQTLTRSAREEMGEEALSMEEALPEVYQQLAGAKNRSGYVGSWTNFKGRGFIARRTAFA